MKTSKAYMLYIEDKWLGYYVWRIVRTPKRAQEVIKEFKEKNPNKELKCAGLEIEEE